MRSLWSDTDRGQLVARAERLAPDAVALWGRMRAPEMLAHLTQSMRMATGELPVAAKRTILRYPPIKHFAVYLMPFPKGLPTAPELLARVPGEWRGELDELRAALDRFVARPPTAPWPAHPVFGQLTATQWGVLGFRHADHHLRQFGA